MGKRFMWSRKKAKVVTEHGDQSREGYKLKLERLRHFAPKMQTEAVLKAKSGRQLSWRPGALRHVSLPGSRWECVQLQKSLLSQVLITDWELAGNGRFFLA